MLLRLIAALCLLIGNGLPTAFCITNVFSWRHPDQLSCPQLSLDALGAKPGTDIAAKLLALDDRSRQPGVLFVSPGRYTIGRSLTLGKPVVFAKGAVFVVPTGVSLTFIKPISAGPYPIFAGTGRVFISRQQPALLVDWFLGDGGADAGPGLNRALQAANNSALEAAFASKTYAIGQTLKKGRGCRISSQPGSQLTPSAAAPANLVGMEYESKGHVRPETLPTFTGFHTAVKFSDVGMTDVFVPLIQSSPTRACKVGIWFNGDSTQVKFGTIKNCETGVLVTTPDPGLYVMQGFNIWGGEWVDTAGVGKQVVMWLAQNRAAPPKWDHSGFVIDKITPSAKATGFAVIRSNYPVDALAFQHYSLGKLGALPAGGRLLDANLWDAEVRVTPTVGFKEGQLACTDASAFNAIRFEGPAAKTAKVHVLASRPSSLSAFKAANGLQNAPWQNRLRLKVPARTWRAGETAQYFLYHQLASAGSQLFFNIPGLGSQCIGGKLAVTAVTDSQLVAPTTGQGRQQQYEVVLDVVACSAFSSAVTFDLAVGAPSA